MTEEDAERLEAEWARHNKASYELGDPEDPKAFIATREQMRRAAREGEEE